MREPRKWDRGVIAAQPPGSPLPTWDLHPARPTLGSQLPCFSSRREKREGERQGCAWLRCPRSLLRAPSLPDRKPAPIPSQLQLCHHRPPSSPGPRSHTPLRGPAAPLRFLCDGPQKAGLLPGAAPAHRPLLRVPGPRPSLPHAGPTRRCLCGTRQRPCLPGPLASESEKA